MSDREEIEKCSPSMGAVVNKAAQFLPKGYVVRIEVEHEGYGVTLVAPDGAQQLVDGGGIVGDVNEAICIANGFSD